MNGTKVRRLKAHRKFRFTNEDLWGYIFIAAAMIIFCVFTLYPVINAVYTSFFEYKPFGSKFIGLDNYVETLKYSKFNLFYKATKNTLIYTAVVVPLTLLISFSVAVMIILTRAVILFAYESRKLPASVSLMVLVVLSKRGAPISFSSALMCLDSTDCDMYSFSAA